MSKGSPVPRGRMGGHLTGMSSGALAPKSSHHDDASDSSLRISDVGFKSNKGVVTCETQTPREC